MSLKLKGGFKPVTGAMKISNPSPGLSTVETLVVAGGGGGGRHSGAGGGAGGLIYDAAYTVTPGSYAVTVGTGGECSYGTYPGNSNGSVGTNGTDSVFDTLTAIGGGGGGHHAATGNPGGSGGGSSRFRGAGGAATAGQGFAGGGAYLVDPGGPQYPAAGGGGAGGIGEDVTLTTAGAGGIGLEYSISGTPTYYAGGGGGNIQQGAGGPGGLGGLGGGGAGAPSINIGNHYGYDGLANTGGGGGGSVYNPPATGPVGRQSRGGSGVVIIKYAGPAQATGGTLTFDSGFTIHTFTESGTFATLEVAPFAATTWSTDVDKQSTGYTLSNNDLSVTHAASYGGGLSQDGISSGKAYFEWTTDIAALVTGIGVQKLTGWSNSVGTRQWEQANGGFSFAHSAINQSWWEGVNLGAIANTAYVTGDTIGIALDMDIGALWMSLNGVWYNGATIGEVEAGTTTNAVATGLTGTYHAAYCDGNSGGDSWTGTANFGATPFTYTMPTGFTGLPAA